MRAVLIGMLFVAAGLLAGCSTSNGVVSNSDAVLRAQFQHFQAQLDELRAQNARLEQEVRALELANNRLQQMVPRLQLPRQPRWSNPETNQLPRLTPLQSQ
jgi:outer membrane murein-binding lipoprotein Lpp